MVAQLLIMKMKDILLHPICEIFLTLQPISRGNHRSDKLNSDNREREKFQQVSRVGIGFALQAWAVFTSADKGNSHDLRLKEVAHRPRFLYYLFTNNTKQ
ncbi:MAG: hypothetical protein IJU19_04555 [Bacteroidales bacterium]|nr:hypothetical protein [Bacteroidales bacterium]